MVFPTLVLIVAAGQSSRFGAEIPKPYHNLNGKPVLRHAIEAFARHPEIDGVRVVIRREDHPRYRQAVDGLSLIPCVVGGASRQESVRKGLESLAQHRPARVLIHDAARPMASAALISRVLAALDEAPAAYPALPVADTLRRGDGTTLDRTGIFSVQTPQGFEFEGILEAHRRFADHSATDDIALAGMADMAQIAVPGERCNFKITERDDFSLMQRLMEMDYETRIGMGTDVHGFVPHDPSASPQQRHVTLCGVKIPHEMRLSGHSDADAGLHALVDALLGAIGAGDIGLHFPDDDPAWAGADSTRFLMYAYQLLTERAGKIVNIDITLLCERPRILPYRDAMRARIAGLLKLDAGRVSVKATTTEKLGFLGRSEGLAAQAVVSVRLPMAEA